MCCQCFTTVAAAIRYYSKVIVTAAYSIAKFALATISSSLAPLNSTFNPLVIAESEPQSSLEPQAYCQPHC